MHFGALVDKYLSYLSFLSFQSVSQNMISGKKSPIIHRLFLESRIKSIYVECCLV